MGAFPNEVEHFHNWLRKNGHQFEAGDFVPRRIYGEYLRDVFAEAIRDRGENSVVHIIDDEAIDAAEDGTAVMVSLRSGKTLVSDSVVLAFGNFLPPPVGVKDQSFVNDIRYFGDAWDPENFKRIDQSDNVLIIGTGLTAVDNILTLAHRGHTGRITAISNHGWLPNIHAPADPYPPFADEIARESTVVGLAKTVRAHCNKAANWRSVIDSLRPVTQETWQRLPVTEKRRFMRHMRRIWDVSRHRMPPQCAAVLDRLQGTGQLQIAEGRISVITPSDDGLKITYSKRGKTDILIADAVINCIGSESNYSNIEFPLVRNLMDKGAIKPDELAIGLAALPNGVLLDRDDRPSPWFRTLGTALKGILWESTAMPEIRVQAHRLALDLLAD